MTQQAQLNSLVIRIAKLPPEYLNYKIALWPT